jgi:serine/threonine protein kinase
MTGQSEVYFSKLNGMDLSVEFKDLILSLFSYDPEKRPTIDQIREHPWLNKPDFDFEQTRE